MPGLVIITPWPAIVCVGSVKCVAARVISNIFGHPQGTHKLQTLLLSGSSILLVIMASSHLLCLNYPGPAKYFHEMNMNRLLVVWLDILWVSHFIQNPDR